MADQTYRVLANRHGNARTEKSQYKTPTVRERAELAVEYRKAQQIADRGNYAAACGTFARALAKFLGFVCGWCGGPHEGRPGQKNCDHCQQKIDRLDSPEGGAA
jgi:hypothetical protein